MVLYENSSIVYFGFVMSYHLMDRKVITTIVYNYCFRRNMPLLTLWVLNLCQVD